MKTTKRFLMFFAIILLGSFALFSPRLAQAAFNHSSAETWLLPDSSASFSTVKVDLAAQSAPAWLQQFSDGIVITEPARICFPFREGQHHWVPQMLQLQEGKWSAILTTSERLDGSEGTLYACAKAQTAGTFVLFAYYNGPAERKSASAIPATLTLGPTASLSLPSQTPTAVDTVTPTPSATASETPTETATETETPTETETSTPEGDPGDPIICPPGWVLVGSTCQVQANK